MLMKKAFLVFAAIDHLGHVATAVLVGEERGEEGQSLSGCSGSDPSASIAADVDAWTQSPSKPLTDPCDVMTDSGGGGGGNSGGDDSSILQTTDDDDDDDDDLDEDDDKGKLDFSSMSASAMEAEIAERKRRRCHIKLGDETKKAKEMGKEAKGKAMTAKLGQKKAQRKSAIAAFKMTQAFAAKSDAAAAVKLAEEKHEEAKAAETAFGMKDKQAKSAAVKAVKLTKLTGRYFKVALKKSEEKVAKAVAALEKAQTAGVPDDPDEAEAQEQKLRGLKDDARDAMEGAAMVKAKADDAAEALQKAAMPDAKPPPPLPVAAAPPVVVPPVPGCDDEEGPFSTKGFFGTEEHPYEKDGLSKPKL